MGKKHITVCICTFKRPILIGRLLDSLENQGTQDLFTFSIVIVDNDREESARKTVLKYSANYRVPILYFVEPEQNIALARNKTVENARGDYLAFIDDDEEPEKDWLLNLLITCEKYRVAGVLGPVVPYFAQEPPTWVRSGRFFERPTHSTGFRIGIDEARTGNLLIRRDILKGDVHPFRARFASGSEDVDFIGRMMINGFGFIWCNTAIVRELVPEARTNSAYLFRRALIRGKNSLKHQRSRILNVGKSLVALPFYGAILPFLFILGYHHFIKYTIKSCDHLGRLLALPPYVLSGRGMGRRAARRRPKRSR